MRSYTSTRFKVLINNTICKLDLDEVRKKHNIIFNQFMSNIAKITLHRVKEICQHRIN